MAEKIKGFVVLNGDRSKYRCWDHGPAWTDDKEKALWFSRREDADALCGDDEDAWYIIEVSALSAAAPTSLDAALDELERVVAAWRSSDITSQSFQMMLGRVCYRAKKGLPMEKTFEQARDLIQRSGTLSVLRDEAG